MDRQGPGKGVRIELIENEGYKFVLIDKKNVHPAGVGHGELEPHRNAGRRLGHSC